MERMAPYDCLCASYNSLPCCEDDCQQRQRVDGIGSAAKCSKGLARSLAGSATIAARLLTASRGVTVLWTGLSGRNDVCMGLALLPYETP